MKIQYMFVKQEIKKKGKRKKKKYNIKSEYFL